MNYVTLSKGVKMRRSLTRTYRVSASRKLAQEQEA